MGLFLCLGMTGLALPLRSLVAPAPSGPWCSLPALLLSVQSPGYGCAPENASVKIPVVSAKWRSSLEAFTALEASFGESRSFLDSGF